MSFLTRIISSVSNNFAADCINVSKSTFGKATLEFLGYHLSEKGITVLPDKVICVIDFPKPTNLHCVDFWEC